MSHQKQYMDDAYGEPVEVQEVWIVDKIVNLLDHCCNDVSQGHLQAAIDHILNAAAEENPDYVAGNATAESLWAARLQSRADARTGENA